ncbi:HD-GYP domain-containing protein [Shewanella algidipiscicola]|uniref:HD family phosphohydrolase n=1 Tax=Shewanella algidipiscicola TaxID=614070 RepID=A0ABQ4P2E6_9GAMM|nr:HD-GYP domain-containing protein [Shewanella algidipiscicola]GIU41690.1 HD family phosphohydrolase [Shewanella algidipiscicola]
MVNKADIIKIAVRRLSIGMYVTAIERQGLVNIAHPGQIKSTEAINQLNKNNIKYVWVDANRSDPSCGLTPHTVEPTQTPSPPVVKKVSREQSQEKAKRLMAEAKDLVQKVLSETFEGKAVTVEPFEDLAENMIESVMLDADAFKCISALRSKDAYLLEHSINVAFLLVTFGKYLALERDVLKQLAVGGILHDIGKVKVDNKILHKPGRLTPEEFEHMKLHQVFAQEILAETQGLSQISRDVCLMHHEKLDGKGYPNGIAGEQISLHGRMSCIVDIFDALTATRCYKEAMSPAAAFKILLSLTPFHLDEALVYEFIRCIGIYPVGSLVQLSDGRVGIVWDAKDRDALHPVLKCFYSNTHKHYIDVVMVDLLKQDVHIERGLSPSSLGVDPTPFY